MEAFCGSCNDRQQVEFVDESDSSLVYCISCGTEFNLPNTSDNTLAATPSKYNNYKAARVLKVEPIPKHKDLKKVLVDVIGDGNEATAVQIVTNAKYIEPSWMVVVALENAIVPAGADLGDGPDVIQIKPCSIGGMKSFGMLCDCPMLDWSGGAKGAVSQLPDSADIRVGDQPPSTRPRG